VSDVVIRAAQRDDVPLLLELFGELAAYEQIEHELKATPELLARALFAERPVAEALIAMRGGDAAGYAIYFTTFSSFRCRDGAGVARGGGRERARAWGRAPGMVGARLE